MKILVTGAAGFIGFHLSKSLLRNGHEVFGIDNINDYYDVSLKYTRLQELGDVPQTWADISEISASGYVSKIDMITGVQKFVDWFKEHNTLNDN